MRVKNTIFSFVVFIACLCGSLRVNASHIYGGELLYKHLAGNQYVLTLTLYGDCASAVALTLPTSVPKIFIYKGAVYYDTVDLVVQDTGIEVSPVCPGMMNMTTCHNGTLPGVKKFVYMDTVTLTGTSSNWRFVFSGQLRVSVAGRSSNITNTGVSTMQLEATLNNTLTANSSPQYTTIPTPFYCLNVDQQYNQGAVDDDGDSLSFSLAHAMNGDPNNPANSGPVGYIYPYQDTLPVGTGPGDFSFNPLNGQMNFTPSVVQNSLVVNQVNEYRDGVLVGTSQREMTFIVSADCEGTPPTLNVVNVTGGHVSGKNVINICEGTKHLSFGIQISNPDGDTTIITPKNVPVTAVLGVVNNNTPGPDVNFNWDTQSLPIGIYTFYLDVKNNHCPIANRQTVAYTINVVPFPTIDAKVLAGTQCVHKAFVEYDLTRGYLPRYVTVLKDGVEFLKYTDSTGVVRDSLPAGNYMVFVGSNPQCETAPAVFTVVDSGKLPLSPITKEYCKGAPSSYIPVPVYAANAVTTWFDKNNLLLITPPIPSTAIVGAFVWYIRQQYKVCISDIEPVYAVVHPLPDVKILTNPARVCFGDTLYLEASGGVSYKWGPADRIDSTGNQVYARMTNPGIISVVATSEYGCVDSTTMSYTKIEGCCKFTFPSAFTPNADGRNDVFRVIAPGHTYGFKLAIYNRWGQMVYLSYNPKQSWDGTSFGGEPCDAGTYFYYFVGNCLVGGEVHEQGDITLIR